MILAIDTSTDQASIALTSELELRAELTWVTGRNHSRQLSTSVRSLLSAADATVENLSGVVVAIGPGSFSGIRVALSAAKALCVALSIPIVGVGTLDVIAFAAPCAGRVLAVLPAGRSQLYGGLFDLETGFPRRIGDYHLSSPTELLRVADDETLLVGPGTDVLLVAAQAQELRTRGLPARFAVRRAAYLAELGEQRLREGLQDSVAELEPLYLRRSYAEEKHSVTPEGNA